MLLLFFLSGLATLLYEVLWLRDLQLLLGSTAYSTATVLAVFFLGQAAGGWVWGRRAARLRNPLRTYALLEAGVAASIAVYLVVPHLPGGFYAWAYARVEGSLPLVLLLKFSVSLAVLLLPSFFMGGTLPVIGQHLVRQADRLGRTGSLLYAVNTLGAVAGALAAGFLLPPLIGCRAIYATGIGINLAVAVAAGVMSRRSTPHAPRGGSTPHAPRGGSPHTDDASMVCGAEYSQRHTDPAIPLPHTAYLGPRTLCSLAFASGWLAISMEVLWTRMFAQVLENSVYAFSSILVVFLLALAAGSLLAHALCRTQLPPVGVLMGLLLAGGLATAAGPQLLAWSTRTLQAVEANGTWGWYVAAVFVHVTTVVFLPGLLLGAVFPYLMRLAEPGAAAGHAPGRILGSLVSINTAGAIGGSLVTGFFLIGTLGQYRSTTLVALAYVLLAGAVRLTVPGQKTLALSVVASAALGVVVMAGAKVPVVWLAPDSGERVVQVWEGSHATVAVTRDEGDYLNMRVNNTYLVGGSQFAAGARALAYVPLLLHPAPRKVFFLGMGTGITAGAALDFPVEQVVVAEYVPEVVAAARARFGRHVNGLFADGRVRIVLEDGRNYLRCKLETYDLIIGDLVYPEQASSLFAREHFETAAARLRDGGLFVQWIPLYQLTESELKIVARTMLAVFPEVTLWRGDTSADSPAVALIGTSRPLVLQPGPIAAALTRLTKQRKPQGSWAMVPYMYYAGNLRQAEALFADAPLNTDDRPLIEYSAPLDARRRAPGESPWFTRLPLVRFYDDVRARAPIDADPCLRQLGARERDYVRAGLSFYKSVVYTATGNRQAALRCREEYQAVLGKYAGEKNKM